MQNLIQAVGIVLGLAVSVILTCAHVALQTITSDIGSENYTFYRLNREGYIRVELHTIHGDADLFVSDKTLRPSYDDFELQSVTCGRDVVDIPSSFKRPVGVSVYGHPSYDNSSFVLTIYHIAEKEDDTYSALIDDDNYYAKSENMQQSTKPSSSFGDGDADSEESPFWTLLISILKIILEILF
ncbi:UPF0669 protein C6orf120 homolog [Gigantopelta aegis]|uniref:UPF0669 protein C6orf120 homolog n=1 Tax=Gigantopelta aegis TaxID=1735272 RepID=UPI001B88863B|nr:UPF0669 protein C6orf120 homolog [Gigantopelta aegis]